MVGRAMVGTWVIGREGRPAARGVPVPERRRGRDLAPVRGPGGRVADRLQPGGRHGAPRHRRVVGDRASSDRRHLTRTRTSPSWTGTESTGPWSTWSRGRTARPEAIRSRKGERSQPSAISEATTRRSRTTARLPRCRHGCRDGQRAEGEHRVDEMEQLCRACSTDQHAQASRGAQAHDQEHQALEPRGGRCPERRRGARATGPRPRPLPRPCAAPNASRLCSCAAIGGLLPSAARMPGSACGGDLVDDEPHDHHNPEGAHRHEGPTPLAPVECGRPAVRLQVPLGRRTE